MNLRVLVKVKNFCYLKLQEESEVPDDETINQMIARSEEEFEIYQVRKWSNKRCCFSFSLSLPVVVLPFGLGEYLIDKNGNLSLVFNFSQRMDIERRRQEVRVSDYMYRSFEFIKN